MNRTRIEWVKNPDFTGLPPRDARGRFQSQGYTWNPITGCLNNCEYCYARRLANGRLRSRYLANGNLAPPYEDSDGFTHTPTQLAHTDMPFYPRFWEEKLGEPIERVGYPQWHPKPMYPAKRKGIFVCDMSDLLGIGIPEIWIEQVMTTVKLCPYHRFYLLTKQPQNLIKWSPFPENCWVGVTATNEEMLASAIESLGSIDATVKFISVEPLLSWNTPFHYLVWESLWRAHVNWLIIGAQTNPYKPPEISWVREIVEAADKVGVKVFLKNNLAPLVDANCPDESDLVPNHNRLFRMKHPALCLDCVGEQCHACGVIWKLRQEMPSLRG